MDERRSRIAAVALLALSFVGCNRPPTSAPTGPADLVSNKLWPEQPTKRAFDLDFGTGQPVPFEATVKLSGKDDERIVTLTHEDQELVERYLVSPEGIALVGLGQDSFVPPIPLLRFGCKLGEVVEWNGINETTGVTPLSASAEIRTSEEVLRLGAGTFTTVRIRVALTLGDAGAPDEMSIWMSPGEGIVQAHIGGYTRTVRP